MFSTLLVTTLIFDSKQANLSKIAALLATKSKRPALVVSTGKGEFSVDAEAADPDTFAEPMVKLGSLLMRSDMSVVRPTILPEANWGILKSLVPASGVSKLSEENVPASALKSKRLIFSSAEASTVNLRSISTLEFEKSIQFAGYFLGTQSSPFKVAIAAPQGVEGVVLAQSLATGLGGRFRVTEKSWFIDFDAAVWRRGFSSLLTKAQESLRKGGNLSGQPQYDPSAGSNYDYQPPSPSMASSRESKELGLALLSQTIGALNDNLVEQTFAYPNTSTRLNLNNYPALKRLIGDFIRSLSAKPSGGATVTRPGQNARSIPANLLNRIDPNRPGELVIETNFRLSVELNLNGTQGGDSQEPLKLQIL